MAWKNPGSPPQAPGAYPWAAGPARGGRGPGIAGDGAPSSLGDLVDVAKKRAWMHQSGVSRGVDMLRQCLMDSLTDDPILGLHSSLQKTQMPHLHLEFVGEFLCNIGGYTMFTGSLSLSDYFLVRGLGVSKASCKIDAYRKATKLIIGSSTEDILSQEDIDQRTLCQEAYHMYQMNPEAFHAMVQQSAVATRSEGYWESPAGASAPVQGKKRPYSGLPQPGPSPSYGPDGKRMAGKGGWKETKDPNALVVPNKVNFVMKPTDKLENKLVKLKQMLKEEGITKLHIVPKVDQFAQRCAITVVNVIRMAHPQSMFVEIYMDKILIGTGQPELDHNNAVISAYTNMANSLSATEKVGQLALKGRRWHPGMGQDPNIVDVIVKRPGQDNGSLLTTNLANMTQMMQGGPDFSIPIERLILTEHEVDDNEHCFKMLELSCTRNRILLECEIIRVPGGTFQCIMSANGKYVAQGVHKTKTGSKRKCSEQMIEKIKKNNDHIYVSKDYKGMVLNKSILAEEGRRIQAAGLPPASFRMKFDSEKNKARQMSEEVQQIENLPENVALRPMLPYMAAAVYKFIDDYFQKVTLEDLVIDTQSMSRSQYEMVTFCALQMGFKVITKVKHQDIGENCSLLRRTTTAQDMLKICQMNGGSSGRYQVKRLAHPKTSEELAQFKADYLEAHAQLVKLREEIGPDNCDAAGGQWVQPGNVTSQIWPAQAQGGNNIWAPGAGHQ